MTDHRQNYFAAVDLGSNSFHLLVAEQRGDRLEVVDRYKEMVQIARGLDARGFLNEQTQTRAIEVLECMRQRLEQLPPENIRAVGTKTLRAAKNADQFLSRAQIALGCPINIISGYEEARLVYKGVCSGLEASEQRRLVIDIGGASTEFIAGIGRRPKLLESLSLGCVVLAERYFKFGPVSQHNWLAAYTAACAIIEPIALRYRQFGWDMAFGSSGTMRAAAELMDGKGKGVITRQSLTRVVEQLLEQGELQCDDLPALRRDVLPAGLAIICAVFDQLGIQEIYLSDTALKEGLIYELQGRETEQDQRNKSVQWLASTYQCDTVQGNRVGQLAMQLAAPLNLPDFNGTSAGQLLNWAGQLHEIGLHISHAGFHKHGHYLLRHQDLGGFSRFEQHLLATLVRLQRNDIKTDYIIALSQPQQLPLLYLVAILRLAIILCRSRRDPEQVPVLSLDKQGLRLHLPTGWLAQRPLTELNLREEMQCLQAAGITADYINS